eukprot:gb/GEZN01003911.1/.p1 GENE.gb/GEZN01003911.1/~~gb/GEZN01003911.1/.p1  ORF type:complete len:635 (+),score=140.18 gb/GEZN01003911.1/:191-1906(+)
MAFLKEVLETEQADLSNTLNTLDKEASILQTILGTVAESPRKPWKGERDSTVSKVCSLADINSELKQRMDKLKLKNGLALQQARFANNDLVGPVALATRQEKSHSNSHQLLASEFATANNHRPESPNENNVPLLFGLAPRHAESSEESANVSSPGSTGPVHEMLDDSPKIIQFEIRKANKFRKNKTKLLCIDLLARALTISHNLENNNAKPEEEHRLEQADIFLPERASRFEKDIKLTFLTWEEAENNKRPSANISLQGSAPPRPGMVKVKKDWKLTFNTSTERERFYGLLRCKLFGREGGSSSLTAAPTEAVAAATSGGSNSSTAGTTAGPEHTQQTTTVAVGASNSPDSFSPQPFVPSRAADAIVQQLNVARHAEALHEAWLLTQTQAGVRLGKVIDVDKKTHPHMKPWKQLESKEKHVSLKLVQAFLGCMLSMGFFPAKVSSGQLVVGQLGQWDPELLLLVDYLACTLHDEWASMLMDNGWIWGALKHPKTKTHPWLKDFFGLDSEVQEFNRTACYTILTSLLKTGYNIVKRDDFAHKLADELVRPSSSGGGPGKLGQLIGKHLNKDS